MRKKGKELERKKGREGWGEK